MRCDVFEDQNSVGLWRVEAYDMEGAESDRECRLAIFSGPQAQARAEEYAALKFGHRPVAAGADRAVSSDSR